MSPTWCDFQNYVKQNFKFVLSSWKKTKGGSASLSPPLREGLRLPHPDGDSTPRPQPLLDWISLIPSIRNLKWKFVERKNVKKIGKWFLHMFQNIDIFWDKKLNLTTFEEGGRGVGGFRQCRYLCPIFILIVYSLFEDDIVLYSYTLFIHCLRMSLSYIHQHSLWMT